MKRIATKYVVMNPSRCVACWECIEKCPAHILVKNEFRWFPHVAFNDDVDACVGCNKCVKTCQNGVFSKLEEATPSVCSESESGKKTSFRIERLLPLAFVASAVSGIGLHVAGHGDSFEVWLCWTWAHFLLSLIWLLSAVFHIKRHWRWCKSVMQKGIGRKSRTTVALSVTFLFVTLTGLVLLVCVDGANSVVGMWHYRLGLLLIVLSPVHGFRRMRKR